MNLIYNALVAAPFLRLAFGYALPPNFTDVNQPFGMKSFSYVLNETQSTQTGLLSTFLSDHISKTCLPGLATADSQFSHSVHTQLNPSKAADNTTLLLVHVNYYEPNWAILEQALSNCIHGGIATFFDATAPTFSYGNASIPETLFFWIDEQRLQLKNSSYPIEMTSFAYSVSAKEAKKLKSFTQKLAHDYFPGLAERARFVGYFCETIQLQEQKDGSYLIIAHLDHYHTYSHLNSAIIGYKGNYFTRWWSPRYASVVGIKQLENAVIPKQKYQKTYTSECEYAGAGVRLPWECAKDYYKTPASTADGQYWLP